MPWIQHYSKTDVRDGKYFFSESNTILIQILDEDEGHFPIPPHEFKYVCRFIFEDTEDEKNPNAMTDKDASDMAKILKNGLSNNWNIVVHCYAGLCRSSAVAIAAQKIGYDLEPKTRLPNKLVMSKLFKELGIEDDSKSIKQKFMQNWLDIPEWEYPD